MVASSGIVLQQWGEVGHHSGSSSGVNGENFVGGERLLAFGALSIPSVEIRE
jgi:hypothetical protein